MPLYHAYFNVVKRQGNPVKTPFYSHCCSFTFSFDELSICVRSKSIAVADIKRKGRCRTTTNVVYYDVQQEVKYDFLRFSIDRLSILKAID